MALQNSNVSRIFQTLGAEADQIPAAIAAPIDALLIAGISWVIAALCTLRVSNSD